MKSPEHEVGGPTRSILLAVAAAWLAASPSVAQGTVFDVTQHGVAPRTSAGVVTDAGVAVRSLIAAIQQGTGPAAGMQGPYTLLFPGQLGVVTIYDFTTTATVSGYTGHIPITRSFTAATSPLDDLSLIGDASNPIELRFHDVTKGGLLINGGRRVRAADLALRYENSPFLQGTIDALGQNNTTTSWVEFTLDPDYPLPVLNATPTDPYLVAPTYLVPFEPATRLMHPGGEQMNIVTSSSFVVGGGWIQKPDPVNRPRTYRMLVGKTPFVSTTGIVTAEVGDRIAWKAALGVCVTTRETDDVVFERVVVRNSGQAAFFSSMDARLRLSGCRVLALEGALLSSNLDGFHCKDGRVGPTVDGCEFERTGDDVVAIAGSWLEIVQQPPGLNYLGIPNATYFRSRVRLQFRNPAPTYSFDFYDGANVPSQRFARLAAGVHPTAIQFAGTYAAGGVTYQVFEIGFAVGSTPALFPGDLAACTDFLAPGFVVSDNTIRDHRARAVFVKASNGSVLNNRIERSGGAGILVGPEIGPFYEASFIESLTIEGNSLTDVRRGFSDAGATAAVTVTCLGAGSSANPFNIEAIARNNGPITIRNNRVAGAAQAALYLAATHDVDVRDNRFSDCQYRPLGAAGPTGYGYGIDEMRAIVHIQDSERVTLQDNVIETSRRPYHEALHHSAGSSMISEIATRTCWRTRFEPLESDESPQPWADPIAAILRGPATRRFHNDVDIEMLGWGTLTNRPQATDSRTLGRQSAYAGRGGASIRFLVDHIRSIEFALGADVLDGQSPIEVTAEPVGGTPISLGVYFNDAATLTGSAPSHWTVMTIELAKQPIYVPMWIRFRRLGTASNALTLLDDVMFVH